MRGAKKEAATMTSASRKPRSSGSKKRSRGAATRKSSL